MGEVGGYKEKINKKVGFYFGCIRVGHSEVWCRTSLVATVFIAVTSASLSVFSLWLLFCSSTLPTSLWPSPLGHSSQTTLTIHWLVVGKWGVVYLCL